MSGKRGTKKHATTLAVEELTPDEVTVIEAGCDTIQCGECSDDVYAMYNSVPRDQEKCRWCSSKELGALFKRFFDAFPTYRFHANNRHRDSVTRSMQQALRGSAHKLCDLMTKMKVIATCEW